MIRRNSKTLIIGILALAALIYFLFFNERGVNQEGQGLSSFKVETIRGAHGWGYHIRQDTTLVIEQKVIPGVPGINGFATEQEAAKTGALVKQKLEHGIFPPTITTHELDSLGIKYQ
ncbi:hypothetical protein GCM10007423_64210 [Dyadobacter endophyticus]|uniref:DUF4907 domain-containing protein n=1 Tax=Dyadobacter endophyticus TaxID=1749036 RepID=A0ABQ1ZB33_9BACT|nr:DUF4907 domain-containing protein [Dyadobacter endophyticus]GGH56036.1 hypothetical protein GCM10007423_64210 [Dyadobacter endophyticus]